jgi:aminoglycoside phosphotransferase (APT) family kinase protein
MNLTAANAVEYLRSRGQLAPGESANARELSGGVSNTVIHIARSEGNDLVLKQAREQLNVTEPWYCSVDRIWREVDVLRHCETLIHGSTTDAPFNVEVPQLLFEDRENYLYAMSAAPTGHVVWKHELLSGTARTDVALSCGTLLGTLHARSWHDASLASQLDDRQFFDDLRLDPYYRQIARVHGSLAPAIERLIDSVGNERHCLVHGDYSPKNLLVYDNRLMLIDFEVGHYGDPAFDLGFFLGHLTLKAYYHAPMDSPYFDLIDSFWSGYCAEMSGVVSSNDLDALIPRGILNFAGCALARLDGKSRIDYLRAPPRRDAMRELCRTIFISQPQQWDDVRQLASRLLTPAQVSTCVPTKQNQ